MLLLLGMLSAAAGVPAAAARASTSLDGWRLAGQVCNRVFVLLTVRLALLAKMAHTWVPCLHITARRPLEPLELLRYLSEIVVSLVVSLFFCRRPAS